MTTFPALPHCHNASGETRRVGVEIEFSGLEIDETAKRIAALLGGTPERVSDKVITLEDTAIGAIDITLDTALDLPAAGGAGDSLRELAKRVVPVEIVTEPLEPAQLPRLDDLCADLRARGARGSRDGVFYGFGVHLNVEIPGRSDPMTGHIVQAYACLEGVLRAGMALDPTRRLLPFVNPWPENLVRDLLSLHDPTLDTLAATYAAQTHSRNHGLDLLPIFKWADAAAFERRFAGVKSGARPAFHFRLPESRIDEPDWDLGGPWAQWHLVEAVAYDAALRAAVAEAWHGEEPIAAIRACLQGAGLLECADV